MKFLIYDRDGEELFEIDPIAELKELALAMTCVTLIVLIWAVLILLG